MMDTKNEAVWRNIQPCIRNAFAAQADQITAQQNTINHLQETVNSLLVKFATIPTIADVDSKIEQSVLKRTYAKKKDVDELRSCIAEVGATVEALPTVKYVENSLRQKMDKRYLSPPKNDTFSKSFVAKTTESLDDLHKSMVTLESSMKDMKTDMESKVCKGYLSEYENKLGDTVQAQLRSWEKEFRTCLDAKADISALEKATEFKVDEAYVSTYFQRFETCLGNHERLLTSLRLRSTSSDKDTLGMGMRSDMHEGEVSPSSSGSVKPPPPPGQPSYEDIVNNPRAQTLPDEYISAFSRPRTAVPPPVAQANSTRLPMPAQVQPMASSMPTGSTPGPGIGQSDDLANALVCSRAGAVSDELWRKAEYAARRLTDVTDRVARTESKLKKTAAKHELSAVSITVDEEKLRLDSVIDGTVAIPKLEESIDFLDDRLDQLFSFLELPTFDNSALHVFKEWEGKGLAYKEAMQLKRPSGSIRDVLFTVTRPIEELTRRMDNAETGWGRACLRIETLETDFKRLGEAANQPA